MLLPLRLSPRTLAFSFDIRKTRVLKLFLSVLHVFGLESCLKCWFDVCDCVSFWDIWFLYAEIIENLLF